MDILDITRQINELNIDDLKILNTIIINRYKNLDKQRQITAKDQFSVGDKVEFRGKHGIITKINQKTIIVETDEGDYRVTPTLLVKSKNNNIVDLSINL